MGLYASGKIHQHYWKEGLQFSEIVKFHSDTSYTSEENFTVACMVGEHKLAPTLRFREFEELCLH